MQTSFFFRSTYLLLATAVLFSTGNAQGNSHNKNAGRTSWTNNGGWDTGNIPGPADTAIINSGTLEIVGAQSIARLRLNGGDLLGTTGPLTDSLTITGDNNDSEWSGGTIENLTLVIGQAAAFQIEGNSTNTFTNAVLNIEGDENFGLANWTSGAIRLNNGSSIENGGDFDDSASNFITFTVGPAGVFNNLSEGNYNKLEIGTTEFDVEFNNDGLVTVDAGTLKFDGGGTNSSTGEIVARAESLVQFDSDYTIQDASKISGEGEFTTTAGTLSVNGALGDIDLIVNGGKLSGTHTIAGSVSLENGELSNGVGSVGSGAELDLEDSGGNLLRNYQLTNQSGGIINWTEGNIDVREGSKITNQGEFNDTADAFFLTNSGAAGSFHNDETGDYIKSGEGTTQFDETFKNDGDVDVNAGTLILNGGGTMSSTATIDAAEDTVVAFNAGYTIENAIGLTGDGVFKTTGGTLDLEGQIRAPLFEIDGGTLKGDQIVFGTFSQLNGTFGTGQTFFRPESVFNLSDSGANLLDARSIQIMEGGLVNWTAGNIDARNGSSIVNLGTFNDTADAAFLTNVGTAGFFNVATTGVYNKNSVGTTEFDKTFNLSGTLNLNAGVFQLDGQGGADASAEVNLGRMATLLINNDYQFSDAASLQGAGQLRVTAGELDLEGQVNVADVRFDGGSLAGDQTFNAGATITNGTFSAGTTTNASGSVLNLEDTGANILNERDIINDSGGTINWKAGNIDLRSGSTIVNNGEFNDTADALVLTNVGTDGSFTNSSSGTYHKNGTGTSEFDLPFDNDGLININSGRLVFDGGGTNSDTGVIDISSTGSLEINNNYTIEDASLLTGTGQVIASFGIVDISGEIGVPDLAISGATITGTHFIAGGSTFTNGVLGSGTTLNRANSVFNLSDAGSNTLSERAIVNQEDGIINWTTGDIDLRQGSSISNQGTFNDTADAMVLTNLGADGFFAVTSTGTYNKNGSGTTTFIKKFDNSGAININAGTLKLDGGGFLSAPGTVNIASDATLQLDSTYTIDDASAITGLGQVKATGGELTLLGEVDIENFEINGATILDDQTFNGGATFSRGTLGSGVTTNASGSDFIMNSSSSNVLSFRELINLTGGTIYWDSGNIDLRNGSTIQNEGTFNDFADALVTTSLGDTGTFTNALTGTYNKDGEGTTEFDEPFDNDGSVNVNFGTLKLDGTGTSSTTGSFGVATGASLVFDNNYTIEDASLLSGTGTFKTTSGTLTLLGEVNINDFRIEGGTVAGDQAFNQGATLQSGNFGAGTTTNRSASVLNLSHDNFNSLNDRDVLNLPGGIINWTSGQIIVRNGSVITNHGTFNDTADNIFVTSSGDDGSFVNTSNGTYNKNGTGLTEFVELFHNSGTVNVNAGTLKLDGTGTASAAGSFDVDSGATLQFDNTYSIGDASKLTGLGDIKATAGTLTLTGQVQHVPILIEGGTINGTHAFHQGATLTNGGFGSGETTVANNSVLNFSDSGGNILNDREIFIQPGSALNWNTGNIDAKNGSFILVQGTLNDTADAHFTSSQGTGAQLTVSGGIYNKDGNGTTEMDRTFKNFGTVNVNSGILQIDGTGESGSGGLGVFEVATGATLKFNSNFTVADAANLQGAGDYLLTAGDLELAGELAARFIQDRGDVLGTFSISGIFDWDDGLWSATADGPSTTITSAGTLNINDTTSFYHERDIINNGTVNWNGGTLLATTGSSFTNTGLFNDLSDDDHNISESSGSSTFTNDGSFEKTGTAVTRIDQTLLNSSTGDIFVSNGVLQINGGGSSAVGSSITATQDGLVEFSDNFTIDDAASLVGDDLTDNNPGFELSAGDLDLNGTLSADLVQTGGELDGTHVISGTYHWNGGRLSADNDGATTTIDSTGVLNIDIPGSHALFTNRDITNGGTVNWINGNLTTNAAGSFVNNAAFNDETTNNQLISGTPAFTNTGTYTKSGGGITEFDSPFDNDGTVVVNAGTLKLDGEGFAGSMGSFQVGSLGTLQFDKDYVVTEAANLSGTGKFLLAAGDLTLDGDLSADFEQSGGNLQGSQVISATFDLGGWGDWNAATDGATSEITSSGVLNISGNSKTFNNRDITNLGTVNWMDGDFGTNSAGSFVNRGTFNDKTDHSHSIDDSSGQATFTNEGTFTKTENTETKIDQDLVQGGALNVDAGILSLRDAASFTEVSTTSIGAGATLKSLNQTQFAAGSSIGGDGKFEGHSGTISGATNFDVQFELAAGTLDGNFTFDRAFALTGGALGADSSITLQDGSIGSISKSGFLDLNGTNLAVDSGASLAWDNSSIRTGNNGGIEVDGLMTLSFDGRIDQILAGDGFFDIGGEFRKTAGMGTAVFALPVSVGGRFEVHSGSVSLTAGGETFASEQIVIRQIPAPGISAIDAPNPTGATFDIWPDAALSITNGFSFTDGAQVTNGGQLELSGGTFAIDGSVDLGGQASLTDGTITGTHILSGELLVNGGSFDTAGTTTISTNGAIEFADEEENSLGRDFTNEGKFTWSDGDLTGSPGATLTNNGEFNAATDGSLGASATGFTVTNNGSFTKTAGTGTTTVSVPFTNNGSVGADTGILHFSDSFSFNEGSIALGGGQVTFAQTLTFPATSSLTGNGTITGNVETNGFVSPGNSIGSINITGDLTLLASSTSFFEVDADNGLSDTVSVSGNLVLGGTLSWNQISTLDPISTDMFTLFTANNLTGTFLNAVPGTRLSTADGHRSFIVNYGATSSFDANSVIFSDFEFTPVPEPSTWALLMTGLFLIGWQGRRRRSQR